jgi:hypothetical protein
MKASREKVRPKKRGRPATGKDPMMAGRMPVALIEEIEAWADAHAVSRSEGLRQLVQLGLNAKPK